MSTAAAAARTRPTDILLSLLVCGVLPTLVYFLIRGHMSSQVAPLAISVAIPAIWTAAKMVWRRRVDGVGVLSVAGFGIRLLVALLLPGGGTLALKVGTFEIVELVVGVLLLGSALVRRPALMELIGLLARVSPGFAALRSRAAGRPSMTLITAVVGALLLADVALHLALALLLPIGTFVLVSNIKRFVLLGVAVVAFLVLRRRRQRRPRTAEGAPVAPDPGSGEETQR
jgi:hypothetical protein